MRLDSANRSFAGLIGASLLVGMLVFCGAVGCVLVVLVVSRVGSDGLDALFEGPRSLWPAVLFIALVGAGVGVAARSVIRQTRSSRRLSERVRDLALPLPTELQDAGRRASLEGRLALVDSPGRFSFVYGVIAPRVAVSRGLLEATSAGELDAVLEHERYHVRNLDPLKVLLSRALPQVFFYVPAFRSLHDRYVAGRELAADRRAVDRCGRRPLAGALLKVVRAPGWPELGAAAAIGGPELLEVRLEQLESGVEPRMARPTAMACVASLVGALVLTGLFVASVVRSGGPAAVAQATDTSFGPLDFAGAVLCAAPWAAGLWLGYRWLSRRSARPLGTRHR